jgi:hypothetical protein
MRSRWLRGVGLLALAAPALVAARCTPRPVIVTPANATQLAAAGTPVDIDFGEAPAAGARLEVLLFRNVDEAPSTSIEVTSLLTLAGARLTGQLGPAELREGRNRLLARIDADDDGIFDKEAWSTFSWEPNVDVSDADRCDPLDRTRCLYPFPNDYFTSEDPTTPTGRRLAIQATATPANFSGTPVDPTRWNRLDGFSVGPMLVFDVPGADLAQSGAPPLTDLARSLDPDSPVALVDADTGERQLAWIERDSNGPTPEQRPLIVRVGKNLPNAKRFAVAIRTLRDAAGDPIPASRLFRLYRDGIPTYDPAIEARRAHMEEVFGVLTDAGIPRDDLVLAWDFTTQSVESLAGNLLFMRDDAFARLGDAAPVFTVTSVTEPTPAADPRTLRDVRGTFEVPNYLTGTGAPGSNLRFGPDGRPQNLGDVFRPDGTTPATFRCTVPRSVATDGAPPVHPARPSLYGHGLLGTENEVGAGNVRTMANDHNFVFCATRWYGMESNDQPVAISIITDFSAFPKFPDRLHQGMLAMLFLGRLMIHPDGFAGDPAFQVGGESVIDRSELFYDGNSQGAIAGGALAAIAQDYERAVLGVPGMNYSTMLDRSKDFEDFNNLFLITYQDNRDRQLLLSLAETLWEQAEVNGHATHITADPYPNTPPKKILLHMAFGDHQTANVSVEVEARSMGARLRTPALPPGKVVPDVEPYYGIAPIESYPYDGSALVVWDSGNPPPPVTNTPPPPITAADPDWAQLTACPRNYEGDPHECPRRQPEAQLQKSEFLRSGGAVVDTCGTGLPCLAPLLP